MATSEEIHEENRKIRRLRLLVDFTCSLLAQGNLTLPEMVNLVQSVRNTALQMFPGKEETFDLIYMPRFNRIIQERIQSN